MKSDLLTDFSLTVLSHLKYLIVSCAFWHNIENKPFIDGVPYNAMCPEVPKKGIVIPQN